MSIDRLLVPTLSALLLVGCGGGPDPSVFDPPIGDGAAPVDTSVAFDAPGTDTGTPPPPDTTPPPPDAGGCPPGVIAPPPGCPPICNGGCKDGVCLVNCFVVSSCGNLGIACPEGMKCRVECSAPSSCTRLTVDGAKASPVEVNCSGTSSCGQINVKCPASAPCAVQCSGLTSCNAGTVACGAGACNAACTGSGAKMSKVSCGPSCSCTSNC